MLHVAEKQPDRERLLGAICEMENDEYCRDRLLLLLEEKKMYLQQLEEFADLVAEKLK